MRFQFWLLVIVSVLCGSSLQAQLNATTIGDAVDQGNNCFTITQDILNQSGGVWYDNAIDFDEDFTILYQNNFGFKDANGADGMALVFKPTSTPEIGNSGGGLGYDGISPSLVVEFDTYQNNTPAEGLLADPFFDHIAIMANGNPSHNNPATNLAGPVQASLFSQNIEDGFTHEIKIEWIASSTTFNVYFDCEMRLSLVYDIKTLIFNGDETVFFGFVGSTGGLSNVHEVCFNSISFVDNLQLQDDFICEGSSTIVDATLPSGLTYNWLPTDGVSDPNSPSPTLSPTVTTTYTVTVADVCGNITEEEFTLSVLPVIDPIFDAIPPVCEGDALTPLPTTSVNGVTGSWSPELNNTVSTTYTFTPDNPCATTTSLEIEVIPLQFPQFDAVNPICEGDSLAPLPTTSNDGITGTWAPALNNLATTVYTFTPNPGQDCAQAVTLEIQVNPLIDPLFDPVDAICEGDALQPLPTISNNGISGTWSPDLDNTMTTTYIFSPNSGECANITSLIIEVEPNVTPLFNPVLPICEGDTLNELPTVSLNSITGSWSPALDNSQTTTYTFIPDANQCANEIDLTIEVIPLQFPEFDTVDPICEGESLAPLPTTSNNGITGTWTPALNNLATTIYTFTPDSGQDCAQVVTLEIEVNPIVVPLFDSIGPICQGDALQPLPTTSNNGISGVWSPELDNNLTTTYTFTPNPGECAIETTLIIQVEPIEVPAFDEIPPICEGDTLNELPTVSLNGISGSWAPALDNSQTTTYTFTPAPNECAAEVNLTIEVIPNDIPEFDTFGPICPGQFIEELPTTSNNGFTGVWTPEINNFETTIYTFTPDQGQGCVVSTTAEIIVTDPIVPVFDEVGPICNGDVLNDLPTVSINGISGLWSPALNNTETTTYTFTPDDGQCAIETTLTIEVIPISQLVLSVEVVSEPFSQNQKAVATVTGGTGNYQYRLDNGPWIEQNVFSTISGCEEHVIRVREASGCSNEALEAFRILEFPRYFTPNGDAFNQFWNIECLNNQPGAKISIFDRYGKLLKVISTQGSGWDGTFTGNVMPTDDYWFKVEYFSDDGLPRTFTSHFTLKR